MYEARKFNQSSYNSSDQKAKDIFSNFITKRGHQILNIEENYEHDVITVKDGVKYYFELEVKRNYPFTNRESFRFNTVSFLGRKQRLHNIQEFHYVIICDETNWAISCESSKIYHDTYIENLNINTSDRKGKDQMFRVPKEDCHFFQIS